MFGKYERNGIAKQLKVKNTLKFIPYEQAIKEEEPPYDQNLFVADFEKINNIGLAHKAFKALSVYFEEHKAIPRAWNLDDSKAFVTLCKDGKELDEKDEAFFYHFAL